MKIAFVVCWFGRLPDYFDVWEKTCEYNRDYTYLLITDDKVNRKMSENVIYIPFSRELFKKRVNERIVPNASIKKPYRLCDFRPMYGVIFKEELQEYDFWGYCDIDLIFGNINSFLKTEDFINYEAIFNGGHFTLIRNSNEMNELYKKEGALFDYRTVATKEAIYAFDETTGIQKIARVNKINAKFGVPYIETESKYWQLRSRMDRMNPKNQAYFWEKGHLYRNTIIENEVYYQEIAYIHLQKRKLKLLDSDVADSQAFWIMPDGFRSKEYMGEPRKSDVYNTNPDMGESARKKEEKRYRKNKAIIILKRSPYQIYVRIRQQLAGINAGDGRGNELPWKKY